VLALQRNAPIKPFGQIDRSNGDRRQWRSAAMAIGGNGDRRQWRSAAAMAIGGNGDRRG
jgi:hypothetical protein